MPMILRSSLLGNLAEGISTIVPCSRSSGNGRMGQAAYADSRRGGPGTAALVTDAAPTVIAAADLTKRYGELDAVRKVSFTVPAGETFGFLGPNGAGKSTTISMLCTLIRPTAGSAKVAGFDVVAERTQVRRNIGLVFQDTTLDDYLTAEENLRFHAELYGVPRAEVGARLRQVLDMVGLWERRRSVVTSSSGGMSPRLELARRPLH